ncbi:molybdopterin-dependent oxidoreductase [Streptomyces sp. NPDC001728]|uniref:molybdopterin-dependent oxidoreductase n=1 Tax=Streptomyces sp. NPDC001728 TaxID=3154396 RepID=UPI0033168A4E
MSNFRNIVGRAWPGVLAGLVAGFAALGTAELVAGLVRPAAAPVAVVGGAVIDRTPSAVKDFAIRSFGENDKSVLRLGILAVVVLIAMGLGLVAPRHRRTGAAGVLLFGLVGALAAMSRPDAGPADVLPSVIGSLTGAAVLCLLASRAVPGPGTGPPEGGGEADRSRAVPGPGTGRPEGDGEADRSRVLPGPGTGRPEGGGGADRSRAVPGPGTGRPEGGGGAGRWNRRGFLTAAAVTAGAAAGAGALGRFLGARRGQDAVASRDRLVLPAPASAAPPVPAGARLGAAGITPFTTPNRAFYRVDTALVVPEVDAGTWRLRIHGEGLARARTYTLADLLARPLIERDITLTCVSNEVGGPYAGNARWLGVPLADLLDDCGVRPPSKGGRADQLVARSVDGMTFGSPVEEVMDGRDAMLAVGMNGEPLPFDHGFPVRMLVPGLYGYVSACKWIEDIELTTFDRYDPYWVKRNWARRAPVKTQSRIDTPRPFARPPAGTVLVAGVAWAQRRGITRVEVRVDDGPWQDADLAAQDTVDTWRQWVYRWQATRGSHTLAVRATDGTGAVQSEQRTRTVPDGASGRHSVFVTVT